MSRANSRKGGFRRVPIWRRIESKPQPTKKKKGRTTRLGQKTSERSKRKLKGSGVFRQRGTEYAADERKKDLTGAKKEVDKRNERGEGGGELLKGKVALKSGPNRKIGTVQKKTPTRRGGGGKRSQDGVSRTERKQQTGKKTTKPEKKPHFSTKTRRARPRKR